jgi:antitoxin (DNA-binding transcriptional repressor) of toxin-antitoxin stability system
MTRRVSKSHFKAHALELFRQVETSGESMIVTDHGTPTIEVRKLQESGPDPFEILRGSLLWYDRPFDPAADESEWDALK